MSRDGWAALPRDATGLSAVCDCGISWSYSLTIFVARTRESVTFLTSSRFYCQVRQIYLNFQVYYPHILHTYNDRSPVTSLYYMFIWFWPANGIVVLVAYVLGSVFVHTQLSEIYLLRSLSHNCTRRRCWLVPVSQCKCIKFSGAYWSLMRYVLLFHGLRHVYFCNCFWLH